MFGNRNQHQQTKAFITAFSTLFNDIRINPYVPDGTPSKERTVPIAFGPKEKWLSILRQDPDKESPSIVLPRMGFDLLSMSYQPERNFQGSMQRYRVGDKAHFAPASYRLEFTLSIMTKYYEDMFDIVEQIIPYFKPSLTVKIKVLGETENSRAMTVTLNSVGPEVEYEGTFEERRVIIYTLSFSVDVPYFITSSGQGNETLIKKASARFLDATTDEPQEMVTVRPGLTPDGLPTTDPAETIPYQEIEKTDNYDVIVEFEDLP